MASRAFSSSTRAAKAMKWKFNGTTVPVDSYIAAVEKAVDALPPKLAAKAEVAIIQGNPHPTPERNDPEHASGRIGIGSVSGKKRLSSFHAYPDGSVKFSDPALVPFNKGPDAEQSVATTSTATTTIAWEWDDQQKMNKYWDGSVWMFWDTAASCCKYWDGANWQWKQ